MRNREATFLILIVLLTALAVWIDFAPNNSWLGRDVSTRLGLDLQGGTQVLLKAQDIGVERQIMQTASRVIEQRVNGLGVSEAVVQLSGNDRIIVELPGVSNPDQAIETLRSTGQLEFIDTGGQYLQPGSVVRTSNNPDPVALRTATEETIAPTSTLTLTGTEVLSDTGALSGTETLTGTGALTGTSGTTSTQTLSDTSALTETIPSEPTGPIYTSITSGGDLDSNSVQPVFGGSQNIGSQYAVTFAFRGESASRLADFTGRNVGQPMCIVLDNVVNSCATIQNALVGGSGQITTQTREEAEILFNQLKYGALPVSLGIESSRTVSATLGQNSVDASLVAGAVGLVVVALFMILYYRLPGVLATVALLIYTAIVFAIYKLIPITLTLAGIAGFILSIGIAVDANVLIFARLKEELRKGRSLRTAVEAGFDEAWPAIRDSSAATLITSVILYMFGSSFGVSIIKGFALTLGLGILVSLFTAVMVTRTFLRLIVPLRVAQNPWMFELEEASGLDQNRRGDVAA